MFLTVFFSACIFAVAFCGAYLAIPYIVKVSNTLKLFDLPNSRKVHSRPVPRLGGAAFLPIVIAVVCIATIVILRMSLKNIDLWTCTSILNFLAYIAGETLLYAIGIKDDLVGVGYKWKFLFQIVASSLLCMGGLWIANFDNIFWLGAIPFWVGMPLTILFVVYVSNAINLIDGIDGLASGLSFISLGVLSVVNLLAGNLFWLFLSVVWMGVVAAFFIYNVFGRRNKIFMGDAGSLTLGFTLAFLILHFWQLEPVVCRYFEKTNMIVMSTLIIPLFDVVRVFFSRLRDGRSPFLPDRNHIHHKLLRTGLSKGKTCIVLLFSTLAFVVISYLMSRFVSETLMLVVDIVGYVVLQIVINYFIKKKESAENIEYNRSLE